MSKAKLAQMLVEKERRESQRHFYHIFPDEGPLCRDNYPRHMEFIGTTKNYTECAFISANQIGKCSSKNSYLELADGSIHTFGELYENGESFEVMAWDGHKAVRATALAPIKKPPESCVRLWFSDGSWFECALNHRILMQDGQYDFVSSLLPPSPQCFYGPLASISEHDQSTHVLDDHHSLEKLSGFLSYCLLSLRFCDAQLHVAEGSARAFLQQLVCVQGYSFALSGMGVYQSKYTSNGQPVFGHLSNLYDDRHFWDRFVESLSRGVCKLSQQCRGYIQNVQRLLLGLVVPLQLGDGGRLGQTLQGAYAAPGISGNKIVAYEVISKQEVYDFTVPIYGNYIANGIVHHNTQLAAFFITAAATGDYPEWWHGKRWDHAVDCWAAGDTNETVRNIIQEALLGPPEAFGTGMIPGKYIDGIKKKAGSVADAVESFTINHVGGKVSHIALKSYDQKRKSFQGTKKHIIWLDEEPPEDIYSECFTRTANTDGIILCTFTPLLGLSDMILAFMEDEFGEHRE